MTSNTASASMMIRYGVGLSAVACVVVITAVSLLAPLVF
jgi:hypothetical protein